MPAKINHVAILSERFSAVARFYQAVFGFRAPTNDRVVNAITVGDGYVGLNINPRKPGRPARLDHFGIEVDDAAETMARMKEHYPQVAVLKRPSNRPFAGLTTHDPDGNVFDLSQKKMANRAEIYLDAEKGWDQPRTISHFALRTLNPEKMAEFYANMFGFALANRTPDDEKWVLSDGRVKLVLVPWRITDYDGTGIVSAGPDHIGIKVESIEALKADIARIASGNPDLEARTLARSAETERRREMVAKAGLGTFQMSDNDNVLIDVIEG
jgi:catechol 2,3-dioxygenase-like lactoylglutathione lyase family enzyme